MMNNADYVTVIGGANIDINGFSGVPLVMGDSNPGRVETCPGGVGRNIAENLARLGVKVRLLTAIGNDAFGKALRGSCEAAGIDVSLSVFPEMGTSVYLALMDKHGEMALALNDMRCMEQIDAACLEERKPSIEGSRIIVIDANLREDAIRYIASAFSGAPLYLDAVSAVKAQKVKPCIGSFDTIKLSRIEAAALSGIEARGEENLFRIGGYFMERGVKRLFITLGREGLFFCSPTERFFRPAFRVEAVNVSGAGDAFMAGIVYASLHGYSGDQTVETASAAAALTVQSARTVSEKMNPENLNKIIGDEHAAVS